MTFRDDFLANWKPQHGEWSRELLDYGGYPKNNPDPDEPGGENNHWVPRDPENAPAWPPPGMTGYLV